jgi:hypothetical protein
MLRRISLLFLLLFSLNAWANGTAGLNYQNYAAGGAMPSYTQDANGNITNRTLLSTGTVNTVGLTTSNGTGLPTRSDGFIVRFYGYINIPTAGTYYFGGQADDGIRIKINNISVVDSWIESGGAFREGSINLSAGVVPVEVMFYENGGGQMVNFQWFMNGYWQIVPTASTATASTYFAPPAPSYSSSITTTQQASKTTNTTARQAQSSNEIYIEQAGDNNNITVRQGTSSTDKNRMTVSATGNSNTLNLNQGYNTDGTVSANDSNNHYLYLNTNGNSNNITTRQTGNGQYNETTISGNNNIVNLQQQGTGSKTLFTNVNGSNNTATVQQKDSGQDYLDLKLTGNGHNVNALQQGSGNHAATINLTNAGGASTVNMTQQGTTAQTYSIQQSCATAAGCSTTIIQGQ